MIPHTHAEYVDGCFRCDLNKDEAIDQEQDERDYLAALEDESREQEDHR